MPQDLTKYPGINALFDYLKGESAQFDRMLGGAAPVVGTPITTNTDTIILSKGLVGLVCTNIGTAWTAAIWDSTVAATGKVIMPATAVALGRFTTTFIPAGEFYILASGIAIQTAGTAAGSLYPLYIPSI